MKKLKITYWITTVLFSVMMLFSATMYFTSPEMAQTFEHLGFPDYFRVELGIAKIIGVLLLLAPFSGRLKEWIYAGFTINMISGSIAHTWLRAIPHLLWSLHLYYWEFWLSLICRFKSWMKKLNPLL